MLGTIQQPYFLPWLGFFAKLAHCDVYIALDDVNYRRNHLSRTQVRRPDGVKAFISLGIGASQNQKMNEIPIRLSRQDIAVHLNKIYGYYSRAECFAEEIPFVTDIFQRIVTDETRSLAELNIALLLRILSYLGIKQPILYRSSEFESPQERTARTVFLAKATRVSALLFGDGNSLLVHNMGTIASNNIDVRLLPFMQYHPEYDQVSALPNKSVFMSGCSVVDALLNVGRDSTRELILAVRLTELITNREGV